MHIVTGAVSAVENITKCVRRCGLEVRDVMLQPLASADAVLYDDEKDLGVCLIDIGGGTTDIAVFTGGAIRHTAVIPIAGDQITNDIAMTLRTPTKEAEELKVALRLRAAPARRSQRHHRGAGRGRARPAQALAPDARRGDRAAHRGALLAGAGGAAPQRLRGAALVGDRAHRRLGADAGHGRARRGGLPHAGARRRAGVRRRAGRRRAQPALRDGGGPAARRARAVPARRSGARAGRGHRRRARDG